MSELADWISILGFIITLSTYFVARENKKEIEELNKKNLFINRLPENLKDLRKSSSALSRLLSDLESNRKEILNEISKLAPILKSIKKSLKNDDLEYFHLLKNEVDKHGRICYSLDNVSWFKRKLNRYVVLDETYVDKIYRCLTTFITDLENLDKDFKKDLLR